MSTTTRSFSRPAIGSREDPTATTTLRDEFRRAFTRRFRALISAVRTTVGYQNDALQLRQDARAAVSTADADDISPREGFTFETDPELADEFLAWLDRQIDRGILEAIGSERVRNGEHYTARFVRAAAERGWEDAGRRVELAGGRVAAGFTDRVPVSLLQRVYQRTFQNLENVTSDMRTEIRRTLVDGLVRGWNPRRMATALNDRVRSIGLRRAETIARTETIRAYNASQLDKFEEMGVDEVGIQVEVLTAKDSRVCRECKTLADEGPFSVDEARGLIPGETHPNCRCALIPKV